MDGLNQLTISAERDGDVMFSGKQLLDTCKLDTTISVMHRESCVLAVTRDDFQINTIDINNRKVVRKFSGHSNRVTDVSFGMDARWLISASMDCSLWVCNLPTGRLVDCFLVDSAVTCLSILPTSDFVATSHLDDICVYL